MKTKLTKEENEILESFEKGEWAPVKIGEIGTATVFSGFQIKGTVVLAH